MQTNAEIVKKMQEDEGKGQLHYTTFLSEEISDIPCKSEREARLIAAAADELVILHMQSQQDTKLIEDLLYLVQRFRYCGESEDYYMEIEESVEKARKRLEVM